MSEADVISATQIIKKLPTIIGHIPHILKGMRITNNTDKKKMVGLGLCFEEAVKKNPQGIAILYQDRSIQYKALNQWSNQIAHFLSAKGIKKGDCVAVLIENRPELLATVYACAKIGAVSAMLNTSQKGRVLTHSVNLVNPKLIIAGEECISNYDDVRHNTHIEDVNHLYLADLDTLKISYEAPRGWQNLSQEISTHSKVDPQKTKNIFRDDPCFYLYTSGTTGLPKAVVFNHGRFMKIYGAFGITAVRLKKNDRMYVPLPFYHATALGGCLSSVIAGNATLILTRKFSVTNFWKDIKAYGATSFGYVGELCRYLVEQPMRENERDHKVRIIVGNGLRPSIWKKFKNRFNIKKVMEFYGSSEGNIGFTNLLNFDQTVGMCPLPYAIVKYDKETDSPLKNEKGQLVKVPKGEVGLLIGCITDENPFHGYTDAAKTRSTILENVFEKGDKWFNSGDIMRNMGYRHAQFIDRTGDTFRWKGENVSTTEVEMLLEEMKEIREAIVYGVEIPNTEGRAGMASIGISVAENTLDFKGLLNKLQENMPDYAIPVFLSINKQVELTQTFKHLKAPLKEQGFDLQRNQNSVYVRLPKSDGYVKLTESIQEKIERGEYRY